MKEIIGLIWFFDKVYLGVIVALVHLINNNALLPNSLAGIMHLAIGLILGAAIIVLMGQFHFGIPPWESISPTTSIVEN